MDDSHLYDADYFVSNYSINQKRDQMYLQERNRILGYYPQGGTILDVGCGVGNFLDLFDDRWEKNGIDPSEFASSKAAKKGITMLRSVKVLEFDTYDVIVFRGTLQHISHPMAALEHATRALKSAGVLVILATPDTDSLVYKIFGNLPALDASRNWVVFGSRMLMNILVRLGYSEIKLLHPYRETPYAQPLRDTYNFFASLFFGWRKFAFPGNMMEIYAIKGEK